MHVDGDDERGEVRATLGEDWQVIESLLPSGWMEMARELGAFRRARGFTDARALLRVLLIHLADGCGLRQTVAQAEQAGLADVSDVALLKRLKSCERWFEWMAQQLREPLPARDAQLGTQGGATSLGARRMRVVDGSVVHEPGPTGSQWRLHYAIGLPGLDCQEVILSPSSDGETLKRFSVLAGDVFIADRGYAHAPGIAHVVQHQADVIVRMNLVTLPLYKVNSDKPFDILEHMRPLKAGKVGGWAVSVHPKGGQPIIGRLCAVRKSAEAAAAARKRVLRESQRGGHEVRPETLEAANYVFVFTTLGNDISAKQVLSVYQLRWQIELEFKRLKSLVRLGHLKKHDDQAARSWLQGKLFVALLIARLIHHAERVSPWGYDFWSFPDAPQPLPVA
jgi:hypothetical protein